MTKLSHKMSPLVFDGIEEVAADAMTVIVTITAPSCSTG